MTGQWFASDGQPETCDRFIDDGLTRRCALCGWWRTTHENAPLPVQAAMATATDRKAVAMPPHPIWRLVSLVAVLLLVGAAAASVTVFVLYASGQPMPRSGFPCGYGYC